MSNKYFTIIVLIHTNALAQPVHDTCLRVQFEVFKKLTKIQAELCYYQLLT